MYDPYVVLGIRRGASAEEVTRAYRALAKKYHPDLNPGDKFAEKKMSEINAAYQQIKTGNVGGAASGYGGSSAYGGSYGQNGGYGQGSGYGQNGGYDYFEQFRRQYGQQYYRQNPTSGKKGGLGWLKVVFVTFLAVQLASLLFMMTSMFGLGSVDSTTYNSSPGSAYDSGEDRSSQYDSNGGYYYNSGDGSSDSGSSQFGGGTQNGNTDQFGSSQNDGSYNSSDDSSSESTGAVNE